MKFERLYQENVEGLYRYAFSFVKNDAAAEDIVAVVFEKAWKSRFTSVQTKPWLYRVARNTAIDFLRKEATQQNIIKEAKLSFVLTEQENQELMSALEALEPIDREIVFLKYWAGLSSKEIAQTVKISSTNVTTRLSRALTKMKEEIQ